MRLSLPPLCEGRDILSFFFSPKVSTVSSSRPTVSSHATSCSGVFRWIAGELLRRRLSCREVWWSFIHRARVSNAIKMTRGVLELTHLFLLGLSFFCFG
ncbi:hypothetical protein F2Q69_00025655 [Brassica cretica]|uniref:Uncharacterized protein n=1 Tax=Brassica cretica TaxID=69181 RepID=A0A8S9S7N3_BRACR|nr:hypothetical protein F2Q69_00025655 [Brassica cretica]